MASIPLNQNGDSIDDIHVEQLLPPDSYADNAFGEPDILPRIGDEYQAQLPPHIGESDYTSYSRNCSPIPSTWIRCLKHAGSQTVSDIKDSDSKNVSQTGPYSNGEINESQNLPAEEEIEAGTGSDEACLLVLGLLNECWSDADKASFLLGLYIFEKNFVEVRRFVESKEMGAILYFYYGKFYGSDEYRRWSECRKAKSKQCVFGQRIFSGQRQQELLSRLLLRVSEQRRSALLEVSKTFGDEKMSLVEYVSSLKAMVGMHNLVEAVGIGTGKQDLTGMALETLRSNQAGPTRPEIPTGKACSSLTTTEIIKFLSGDYRLSKARSNDLFWEAVWPRLLARGWHSEQPKNQGYINHCLVFLMPGVKKFSRRKLVKGDHYFDSVSEILSKVAKEPGLIELDDEEVDRSKNKEDHELTSVSKLEEDEDDLLAREQFPYLQPRTPNRGTDVIKFTVVDTSMSDGKVRELRALPPEISNAFLISLNRIEDRDKEENTGESVTDNQESKTIYPDISKTSVPFKNKKDLKGDKKLRKVPKSSVLSRKQKRGNVDYIAPISKRCKRLTANSHQEMGSTLESGMSTCFSGFQEFDEKKLSQLISCHQDKLSSTISSSKGSPVESIECIPINNIHSTEPFLEKSQSQPLIDLNLPRVPQEFENGVLAADLKKEQDNLSIKLDNIYLPKSSDIVVNPRRHSTRNHAPTTRALEAVANGYLTVNRRRKYRAGPTSHDQDLASRPPKRDRGEVGPTDASNKVSQIEEAADQNGVSNSGDDNIFIKFQVLPENEKLNPECEESYMVPR